MTRDDLLKRIHVAVPCPKVWEPAGEAATRRHCDLCNQDVFDLSMLTRAEANALLASRRNAPTCVTYQQQVGGEILTADRPREPAPRRPVTRPLAQSVVAFALAAVASACGGPGPEMPDFPDATSPSTSVGVKTQVGPLDVEATPQLPESAQAPYVAPIRKMGGEISYRPPEKVKDGAEQLAPEADDK